MLSQSVWTLCGNDLTRDQDASKFIRSSEMPIRYAVYGTLILCKWANIDLKVKKLNVIHLCRSRLEVERWALCLQGFCARNKRKSTRRTTRSKQKLKTISYCGLFIIYIIIWLIFYTICLWGRIDYGNSEVRSVANIGRSWEGDFRNRLGTYVLSGFTYISI